MKPRSSLLAIVSAFLFSLNVSASVLYVSLTSTNPEPPYADWDTAATNIQDAIDAANPGDEVLVTNGVYATGGKVMAGDLTNRIALDKAITVQSVNGPWVTIIQGAWDSAATNGPGAVRCAWLTNRASLIGFTLQGGATRTNGDNANLMSGGGAWCASSAPLVANCVLQRNFAAYRGGGSYQGTLNTCFISHNYAPSLGGGGTYNAFLEDDTVTSNATFGVYGGRLTNCIVYFNGIVNNNFSGGAAFAYCCTTPWPGSSANRTGDPQFSQDGLHLTITSPCRGTGTNVVSGTDIFEQPWANPPSIGCAEYQPAPFVWPPQFQLSVMPIGFTIGLLAVGEAPLTYTWLKDGAPIQNDEHFSGSQTAMLTAIGIALSDAGNYQVIVTNDFGAVTSQVAQVVIHCVDAAGANPVSPYTSWATAATNIQDAIDAAAANEIVLVTNGLYASGGKTMDGDLTNRVSLDKPIMVTSVNGFAATVIQGAWDPATTNGPLAVRCAWLTNGAVLNGFTLRNGATRISDVYTGDVTAAGGGAWCASTNGVVSNCFLTNNSAIYGGGMANGTLNNSLVVNNSAGMFGGGAFDADLNNCTVYANYTMRRYAATGAGTYNGRTRNSIVGGNFNGGPNGYIFGDWDNYAANGRASDVDYAYCCVDPGDNTLGLTGPGNIGTNAQFLDLFHIATTSPCVGAGSPLYATGTDLDGEPWANPPAMGCDEVILTNLVGPLAVSLFAYQTNLVVNYPASFWATISGRASRAAWSFGDGPTVTNFGAFGISHPWTNSGDYDVIFTAYNYDHPAGVSTNVSVHVDPVFSPLLQSAALTTNGFEFQFTGQQGLFYDVQMTTNLAPPVAWQTLQSIYSFGGVTQVDIPNLTNPAAFYRVHAH